jgi:dTDP-4-dehydrorhamnose 3,5-epimerase
MLVQSLEIPEVKLITPERIYDERGFFSETYNRQRLREAGVDTDFVQDNHSFSSIKNVVRGLHFQVEPHAQGKLVRVIRGAIFDVALDLRRGSSTYGRHVSTTLSANNWRQIWIPEGFAHGFCTLEPNTEVFYKTTAHYAPNFSRGIKWDDPALGIAWPARPDEVVISDADRNYPHFADLPAAFESGQTYHRT